MTVAYEVPAFGPLQGVKVVYSAVEIAVPTTCQIMAEWGADVTWLENVYTGDSMRDTKYVKEHERKNMKSLSINIFSDEGKEILLKLVKDADIFIESSKGPAFAKRGITDELLWGVNPKLVIVHISGFGHTGDPAMVNRAAYDITTQAYSGYLIQNGSPKEPMYAGPYAGDYFSGLFTLGSALAALHKAQVSGIGESVDVAMYEAMLRVGSYYMMDYLNEGTIYPRPGQGHQNLCGIGVYECADGYISLCLYGVKQNKYLLETIGLGHIWGTEEYPEDTSALWLNGPKAELIEEKLRAYLGTQRRTDVEKDFSEHAIAAQVVMTFDDIVKERHFKEREAFVELENVEGKTIKMPGIFPKFKRNPGQIWRPMPTLGMDTENILTDLGYSKSQIDALSEKNIVKRS